MAVVVAVMAVAVAVVGAVAVAVAVANKWRANGAQICRPQITTSTCTIGAQSKCGLRGRGRGRGRGCHRR